MQIASRSDGLRRAEEQSRSLARVEEDRQRRWEDDGAIIISIGDCEVFDETRTTSHHRHARERS
jgi:hypothetical protein